jgi:ubiquinone/menaquinone biosynthesis C-methylase UbiE
MRRNTLGFDESAELVAAIEQDARRSYNAIASGYNDPSHHTVRNFEVLVRDFIVRHEDLLLAPLWAGLTTSIDVGGGRGWVARMMADRGFHAILADLSDQMLAHAREMHGDHLEYRHVSAFDLPFADGSTGLITTNLCGAYLGPTAVAHIHRVLAPQGIHLVTETPTEWVQATHPDRVIPDGKTWYKNAAGDNVHLPFTYIYKLDELATLLSDAGFKILVAETLTPAAALPEVEISAVNRKAAEVLGVSPKQVPILSAIIAQKP